MKNSDFKRKLFWECIDNLGSKGRSSAAKLAEPALHIPQQTHAGSEASTQICQMIVDDLLSYLERNAILTRPQCMSMREAFLYIVAGKLQHT